ncbi:hypothetical protein LXA43DRAFT_907952 [Ganoderma leucocontextum]|nr:hypothetical protein LXA43DRAFT_907952 [Ganoderma leucocontextum]
MPRSNRHRFRPQNIPCTSSGCPRLFSDQSGLKRHVQSAHRSFTACVRAPASEAPPSPSRSPSPGSSLDNFPNHAFEPFDDAEPLGDQEDANSGRASPQTNEARVEFHPVLNVRRCNKDGDFLPENAPPPPPDVRTSTDYTPFESRIQFEVADFLYRRVQMSSKKINELMQLWAVTLDEDRDPPFAGSAHLYDTIDEISNGDVSWQEFSVTWKGSVAPTTPLLSWQVREYPVFFRDPRPVLQNQLGNTDFAGDIDFVPKHIFGPDGRRIFKDFMSGDWVWSQADKIAADPRNHGAAFCAAAIGSDKTTVSVATGQNEYYPLYLTNGNVTNSMRRSHRNAITLIGFLAIPKTDRQYANDPNFRKFRRELFHTSLRYIFELLCCYMSTYDVVLCGDGYYRRIIYGLGPYVADYPEQVLLACTVQGWCCRCTADPDDLDTGQAPRRSHELTAALLDALTLKELWDDYGIVGDLTPFTAYYPRADIHELLSPDLLHQVIKGTFKDHLVTWVEEYLELVHGKAGAAVILADIDRRIAAAPPFPGLRRFPEGRGFKQWTGDDSKALMKVYLPAIAGHVPPQMVRALSAFLDFCYYVRRDTIDEGTLAKIDSALERFHCDRVIFIKAGVRSTISLPRQHSLKHYPRLIRLFGSPNGLCSSMMEAKHIIAVKQPYRRSSRNRALGQIIQTNQRLDKLAAIRVEFSARGMLQGACPRLPRFITDPPSSDSSSSDSDSSSSDSDSEVRAAQVLAREQPRTTAATMPTEATTPEDDESGPVHELDVYAEVVLAKTPIRGYPRNVHELATAVKIPSLPSLIRFFLYDQLNPNSAQSARDAGLARCPPFDGNVRVFPSAIAIYYAPSDPSGPRGMHRERICSVQSWRGGRPRRDCVFVSHDESLPGFRGLHVARVHLFFSFAFGQMSYSCALVTWFSAVADEPDADTGMWIVAPDVVSNDTYPMDIISLDSIVRSAHLIGVAGKDYLPRDVGPSESLDVFREFYVNKFADHHSHEIAF